MIGDFTFCLYVTFVRNNNLLSVPSVRLYTLSKHPLVNLPKTWLEFSNENIKTLRNKTEFKTEVNKYLLNELVSVVTCNRLQYLCPTSHLNA